MAGMRIRRVQRTWARATRKNAEMFNWKTFVIKLLKLCAHKARRGGGEKRRGEGGKLHQNYLLINLRQKLWNSSSTQRFRFGFRIEFCASASRMNNAKVIYLFSFILFYVKCFMYFVLFYFSFILPASFFFCCSTWLKVLKYFIKYLAIKNWHIF